MPDITEEHKKNVIRHTFKYFIDDCETEADKTLYINNVMSGIEKAAAIEYSEMVYNHKRFASTSELNQYRLFLMVEHVFQGIIPTEYEVSQLFSITFSNASTLIKNMRGRYQFELESSLKSTIQKVLAQIGDEAAVDHFFKINIRSKELVSAMNEVIASIDSNHILIKKIENVSNEYKIRENVKSSLEEYCR